MKLNYFEGIGFDLDNTLYDELDYYNLAFDHLYKNFYKKKGIDREILRQEYLKVLKIKGKHYGFLFNDILKFFGLFSEKNLAKNIEIFSSTEGRLDLYSGLREKLIEVSKRKKIILMTGGLKRVQKNKIKLLNIDELFELKIFSSYLKYNKPHRHAFQVMAKKMGTKFNETCYVGDNPLSDFKGANELGIFTFQVSNKDFNRSEFNYPNSGKLFSKSVLSLF